ncbi:unnamed protein product, partial [Mesorhabditis belari]|uniref:Mediator of RNA polymerase II transcription subunit 20 n=1 Tax=Mesorhabditis belari TaxID=2138241 RepID=A0AAF3ETW2_9BILA
MDEGCGCGRVLCAGEVNGRVRREASVHRHKGGERKIPPEVMGVSWVIETERSQNSIEQLIESGGGTKIGLFVVDSSTYRPVDQLANNIGQLNVLHHSNFPESTFSLAVTATNDPKQPPPKSISDRGFDLILSKLSGALQMDSSGKFDASGTEYSFKDFRVRVGTVTQGGSVKGVVVEIEYTPTWVANQASMMLSEFINMFFPEQTASKPEIITKPTSDLYTALDTLNQYQQIFNRLRKKA